jgi:hypothetical protein
MNPLERIRRGRSVGRTTKAILASCVFVATAMAFANLGSAITVVIDIGHLGGGTTEFESRMMMRIAGPYGVVINDLSQITGLSYTSPSSGSHVFVWDETLGMRDLGNGWLERINNAGQVYYNMETPEGIYQGAVWEEDEGTTYVSVPNCDYTEITDMNDIGTAVGLCSPPGSGSPYQAFRAPAVGSIELLAPLLVGKACWANSVNALNVAVGVTVDDIGRSQPCFWDAGDSAAHALTWGEIAPPAGDCHALMMNYNGQVMGSWSTEQGWTTWGTFYGSVVTGIIKDIGTLDDLNPDRTNPIDMNENGVIVGEVWSGQVSRAFVWDESTGMVGLPSFDAVADANSGAASINDVNQIAGWCVADDGARHACLWECDSSGSWTIRDLQTGPMFGSPSSEAFGINNKGEVACTYMVPDTYDMRVCFWKFLTAQEASGELADDIEELVSDENVAKSMTVKVGAAQHQMDRGNDNAAVAVLEALIHQTEAQIRAGKISEVDGAYLMAQTQAIIDELMNPAP